MRVQESRGDGHPRWLPAMHSPACVEATIRGGGVPTQAGGKNPLTAP